MKRDEGFAAALFAVVIGGAVALAIAGDIAAPACKAARAATQGAKDFDFGCLEFWLNRYQTTLQTAITGGIGAAGLFFVLRQLNALSQQNQMTQEALALSLREAKASDRASRLRARQAIRSIAGKAFQLQFESIKAFSPMKKELEIKVEEFVPGEATTLQILGGLYTRAENDEWERLIGAYSELVMFINTEKEDMHKLWKGKIYTLPECISTARRLSEELHVLGNQLVPRPEE